MKPVRWYHIALVLVLGAPLLLWDWLRDKYRRLTGREREKP